MASVDYALMEDGGESPCTARSHSKAGANGENIWDGAEEGKAKTIFPTHSHHRRDLILVFICMGCCVGSATGVQAIFQGSKARGVFSELCTEAEMAAVAVNGTDADGAWCEAQESATALVAVIAFSFLNAVSFMNGNFVDALGGRRAAIIFISMWAVATCAAGLDYVHGYVWSACMLLAIWGVEGAMLCILVFHLRLICIERDDLYNFWSGGFTSLWDLGTFLSLPIGRYWLREATIVPFEVNWLILGVTFAIPTILWMLTFSRRHKNQLLVADGLEQKERMAVAARKYEAADPHHHHQGSRVVGGGDGGGSGATAAAVADGTTALTCTTAVCASVQTTKAVLVRLRTNPTFWLLTAQAMTTVTTSSFFIATVGVSIKQLGGTADEISQGRFIFAYLRGASSVLYFVPSFVAQRLGVLNGMTGMEVILALNALLISMCSLFEPEEYSIVRTILLIIVFCTWRAFTFSSLNIVILERFRESFGGNIGFIYGLVYSIGGTFSLVSGSLITSWATAHPHHHVIILGILCGVTTIVHVAIAATFHRQGRAAAHQRELDQQQQQQGEEQEEMERTKAASAQAFTS